MSPTSTRINLKYEIEQLVSKYKNGNDIHEHKTVKQMNYINLTS